MKLFQIEFKKYSETLTFHVAARTITKATEQALIWIKKNHYSGLQIVSITKVLDIEAFVR